MSLHSVPAIIPQPSRLSFSNGRHTLNQGTKIVAPSELLSVARFLQTTLQQATGWPFLLIAPEAVAQEAAGFQGIFLSLDAGASSLGNEGYRLRASWDAIRIQAPTPAGVFYAVQTLLQLLPAAVFNARPRPDVAWTIPCVVIEDSPRFVWRGAMLDCSRYFQPVAFVKKFIDALALHKLNTLHWHLTDDQGWRIEIKKYPRLTEIGSRRTESPRSHHDFRTGGDGVAHEGYYTQDQIREIVAYAAARFVTVVPEIEMPGHAQAAIAAYPELGSDDQPLAVSTHWGCHLPIFNPNESTLSFLQDVLDEVLSLFPSRFIHVGGDEAAKAHWENNPAVRARMAELGIADAHALQSYFITRMENYLAQRGRRLVGWDEILEGGLPPGATVMSWRGIAGGITAANAGHDVVMAPNQYTYLDHYQAADTENEPLAICGCLTPEKLYSYEPIPREISAENAVHILGIQGQLWSEYMPTSSQVEYMAFPRLCALAEVAWSPPGQRDFESFRQRLKPHLKRLDILGVRYRPLD